MEETRIFPPPPPLPGAKRGFFFFFFGQKAWETAKRGPQKGPQSRPSLALLHRR